MTAGLAVHAWGRPDGPTLVLFHGNGDSGRCWPDAVERWAPDYRVLAVDARGHGRSPRFTTAELDRLGEVFTDDTEAVLEDVRRTAGAYPVLAVGHSLGAGTLAAVMARRPDLLNAAVLIDPPWDSPLVGPEPRPEIGGARVEFIVACMADPEGARAEQAVHNPAWSSAEQQAWLEAKQEVDLAMVAIGNGRVTSPWPGLCARLTNPTLVVTGDPARGVLVGEQTRTTLAAIDNPAITVVEILGADHYVRQSAPDAFHAIVDPWVAAHL